jgi:cell division protein ZapA
MGQVTLTLNGRAYRVGCGDGQEERLAALAAHVSGTLEEVLREFGQVGEARLFLLTSLLIADELLDARAARDTAASTAAAAALREIAERAMPEKPKPLRADPKPVAAAPEAAPPAAEEPAKITPEPEAAEPKLQPQTTAESAAEAVARPEAAAKPVSSLQAAINRIAPPEARKAGSA